MTQHVQQEQSLPFSPGLLSTENEGALRLLQRCVNTIQMSGDIADFLQIILWNWPRTQVNTLENTRWQSLIFIFLVKSGHI